MQIYDGDIGHHLKSGEWMVAHGRILDKDIFSHTARGNRWLNHSWMAEIFLYFIYFLGGINGLSFFKILILVLSYAIVLRTAYSIIPEKTWENESIIAILFIMAVLNASPRFLVRPLIFTYLGFALSIYVYFKSRDNIRYIFYIPLILLFWANLHAEFILGLIIMVCLWLYITFLFIKRKVLDGIYSSINTALFLSLGAILITPYGIRLFTHPVSLTTSDLFMTRISEWLPPTHFIFRNENFIKIFYYFFGIGLLSFMLNFKKKDTPSLIFFIVFGLMSFSAIRFMPYFTMLGIPILSENLIHFKDRIVLRVGRLQAKSILEKIAIIGIIVWSMFLIERRTHYSEFGIGLAERVCYPLRAGRFMEEANIRGNIFNMVDFGGYLIWYYPDRPVFVDGRLDVYGEKIYKDFLSPTEQTFERYNINCIFLSFRHPVTRGLLYRNDNWPLVYWDDTALIYLKKSKKNMNLINKYGYKYIHPLTGSYNFLENASPEIKKGVWKEIHRALRLSPDSIRAHVVLGDIYVELKDYRNAIQSYEQAISLGKRYHTEYMRKVYHNLAKLYHNLGQYPKAEEYYKKVLKLTTRGEKIYLQVLEDWAQLNYIQGKKYRAFRLIKEALRYKKKYRDSIFSDYPVTLAKLALLYEDLGKKDKAIVTWQEVYEIGWGGCRKQAYEHLKELNGYARNTLCY